MVLSALGVYGVLTSPAFLFRRLELDAPPGAVTDREAVLAATALSPGAPNLFALRTDRLVTALLALPAVTGVTVSVALPGTLRVVVEEREPILIWTVGGRRLMVDRDGVLFAGLAPGDLTRGLPGVADNRSASAGLDVGSRLDPVDLDAATRLVSLKPSDIGSGAHALRISIEDEDGYLLHPEGLTWVAAFGVYTPTLRTPDLVPGQVRLLRSLLAGRESTLRRVVLADDRTGTYTTR